MEKKYMLISVNKPHTDNIFSGKKGLEWRKKPLPEGLYYVYETKNKGGCGKVIGEMRIVGSTAAVDTNGPLPVCLVNTGCVHPVTLKKYANNGTVYANFIKEARRYDKPLELESFIVPSKTGCCNEGKCRGCPFFEKGNGFNVEDDCTADFDTDEYKPVRKPPQSWCYVEEMCNGSLE